MRAMVEIAKYSPDQGIFQKDVAFNQNISNKYLDHIMHALKVAGLIRRLGHRKGYVLTRNADQITAYDINNAFEPGISVIECLDCLVKCPREPACSTQDFWRHLNKSIIDIFQSTSLQDLLEQEAAQNK